jgi:hypothetical protein
MNRRKLGAVVAAAALAAGGVGALAAASAGPGPAGDTYTAVAPVRICDTRGGTQVAGGCSAGQVAAGGSVTVSPDAAGISGESAVVLNVTATGSPGGGNITVDPAGVPETSSSNLNYSKGQTVPNLVIVQTGAGDRVTLYNNSSSGVQLIVDLEGYYTGPGASPTTPAPTAASASPAPPVPLGMAGTFTLIGGDEFNGTSLDTSMWTPGWFGTGITGPVNSGEHQGYDSANVTEPGDGTLHLALTSAHGALVSSNTHFSFASPGAYEARVYLPGSAGDLYDWPAAWTDGQSWPADGEIDAVEGLGTPDTPCFHVHTSAGGPGGCPAGDFTGWHTYGFQWTGTAVTFYYDGADVGSEPYSTGNSPQYLVFDNTSTGTPVPDVMQVDYVRVWSQVG